MNTVTVDLVEDKALLLLEDLENMQLIRLRTPKQTSKSLAYYKGILRAQPLSNVESQLKELRQSWG